MMSRSLQIDNTTWQVSFLGEQALSLNPPGDREISLSTIHKVVRKLEQSLLPGIVDIISSYEEITLIYNRILEDLESEALAIEQALQDVTQRPFLPKLFEVPVCYELGLDWEGVESHLSMTRDEIKEQHHSQEYTLAMMGFLPGFLYLSGMKESLTCPRKANPRAKIPAGSVGIGGTQTGIYALESPGGWQIIGRTPVHFFDINEEPPIKLQPGDHIRFTPISEQEYKKWNT